MGSVNWAANPQKRREGLIALCFLLLAATSANASTMLVSNFGPGNIYNANTADFWVTPSNPVVGDPIGFVDPSNSYYNLVQVQVGADLVTGATKNGVYNEVNVGFWESPTNNLNDAVQVQSWNFVTPSQSSLYTLTSNGDIVIKPGQYYFLTGNVLPSPIPATAQALWAYQWGTPETVTQTEAPGQSGYIPIFAISVAADDPEPQTVLLAAAGLALVALAAKRRGLRRQSS